MKKKFLLIALMATLPFCLNYAQVQSVNFVGAYGTTFSTNSDWKVESVKGYGGDVQVKINLQGNWKLGINAGYRVFSVKQDNFALFAEYNWKYWQRYYGNINDPNFKNATQWVQLLLKGDSTYSASFEPVQDMDVFPVAVNICYEFSPVKNLVLRPYLGTAILFYQKRLYINETWSRKFADADNYVYSYSFRDMDTYVVGNPLAGQAGFEAEYQLNDLVKLTAGAEYYALYGKKFGAGYSDFPMKDMFSAQLGIMLLY
jgi:hypothetical protein